MFRSLLLLLLILAAEQARATVLLPSYARGGLLFAATAAPPHTGFDTTGCVEHNLTVPLDWENTNDDRTMTVRYWIDDSCRGATPATDVPIFVQMGGEGAASCWPCAQVGYWNGGHAQVATTVSVEHRFYGRSIPMGGLISSNLPFLTTPQNLADTAAVVKLVNPNNTRRLLNFGGSYSGGTAAWFRIRYPTLTHAAVSSSGVVDAIVDYVQFDASIVATLKDYSARMFPSCFDTVSAAMDALDALSETELRAVKTHPFNASVGQTDVDFLYMVADAIAMSVQYGGKQHLCSVLSNITAHDPTTTPMEAIAQAIPVLYGHSFQQGCFYDTQCIGEGCPFQWFVVFSGAHETPALTSSLFPSFFTVFVCFVVVCVLFFLFPVNTVRDSPVGVGNKAWRWQKCSLLGYIQSRPAGSGRAARSRRLTLASQQKQCEGMFPGNEKDLATMVASNAQFQQQFGGAHPVSRRWILLVEEVVLGKSLCGRKVVWKFLSFYSDV